MNGETAVLVQRRRRRSRAEADRLVEEFEASGLTRQSFCAGRGLSLAALDKYRRQHKREMVGSGGRMVPVEVLPATRGGEVGSALCVELANGCRIAVGSGFDVATLKRLVAVLAEA